MSVTYDDLLSFFSSQTIVPSRLGVDLTRLRDGLSPDTLGNHKLAQEREEMRRLKQAHILRCVEALARKDRIRFGYGPDLAKFARRISMPEGILVTGILSRFEPWATQWPEKGLAEVYAWLCTRDGRLRPVASPKPQQEPAMAFRLGQVPHARKLASALVADAHVVLYEWVTVWERGHARTKPRPAA